MAEGKLLEIYYERVINGTAITYRHIAPPCSKFRVSFADVDKKGSGRSELTMFRERLGYYCQIEITWDLIPNTKEYNNWYKILTHLPPYIYADVLMPSGEIENKQLYRGDISTELYLFVADKQIWQGLSTTFIQYNLDEYDDSVEPELEQVTEV